MFVLLLESGAPDNLLLESGDGLWLEDGTGVSTGDTRVSQAVLETLTAGQVSLRASQVVLEALIAAQAQARISQMVLEVITPYARPEFPALRLYG